MNRRKTRMLFLLGACAALVAACLFLHWRERSMFMGVPVMNERAYAALPEYAQAELEMYLTQNGQPAALDRETSVLYVSVDPRADRESWRMPIKIELHHPGYQLYFAPDAAFDDFEQAIADGHRFTLIAAARDHHMRYEVVFTALPVLRLNTQSGLNDYEHKGDVCLWWDYPSDEGYYSVSSSPARWHERGGSSRRAAKASYKITLEKKSGGNQNLSFLGMGKDDDWIINGMVKDDLKLREKTITTLWNEHQSKTGDQLLMAPCHYVEAVIDGRYCGLYLLQRRVDDKLLGQKHEKDVIYKGDADIHENPSVETAFPVKENPEGVSQEELSEYILPFYRLLQTRDAEYDVLKIDEINWLDLNVFCSIFALADNLASKNFYLLRHEDDGEYALQFVLWDTDVSMGLGWKDEVNDIRYDAENVKHEMLLRTESEVRFRKHEHLYPAYVERYAHLRETLLSEEHILQTVLECFKEVTESGALRRDQEKWGLNNQGEDTIEKLTEFIHSRIVWLDEMVLKAE